METLQNLLVSFGLGSPISRGIFGAAIGSIPVLIHSPVSYYKIEEGVYMPKSFYFTSPEGTAPEHKTYLPWYIFPLLGATLFALFL